MKEIREAPYGETWPSSWNGRLNIVKMSNQS